MTSQMGKECLKRDHWAHEGFHSQGVQKKADRTGAWELDGGALWKLHILFNPWVCAYVCLCLCMNMCVHACVYVCVLACVHACACVLVCVCKWKPEINVGWLSQSLYTSLFWGRVCFSDKIPWSETTWGGKGWFQLAFPHHSLSSKAVRAGPKST